MAAQILGSGGLKSPRVDFSVAFSIESSDGRVVASTERGKSKGLTRYERRRMLEMFGRDSQVMRMRSAAEPVVRVMVPVDPSLWDDREYRAIVLKSARSQIEEKRKASKP